MSSAYRVIPYNPNNLANSLSNSFLTKEDIISRNSMHFRYLVDYLSKSEGIGATTIVIEEHYISKAFLNDFASYYALCFKSYEKVCKRIHFFNEKFSAQAFDDAILDPQSKSHRIWDSYLGYVVAKPLPEAIIGPTILKTYESDESNERNYITKSYKINLFGKSLDVHSVAYQEQDSVVSACATTAIWSAFHKTAELFQTRIPTPNEITRSAGNLFFESGRSFPNRGLDITQIGKAIESVGLVSELHNNNSTIQDNNWIKSFVYAYVKAGIPVLLAFKMDGDHVGHLIAVTGYKKHKSIPAKQEMQLVSHEIQRLYAHDDGIGPYSRLGFTTVSELENPNDSKNSKTVQRDKLVTSWKRRGSKKNIHAEIDAIIVPIHPKIRINFDDIYNQVKLLNLFFSAILKEDNHLHWDVYLCFSNIYKSAIRESNTLLRNEKKGVLENALPKHVWIAEAKYGPYHLVDFVFDATDFSRGFYCLKILFFSTGFKGLLGKSLENPSVLSEIERTLSRDFRELFQREAASK